MKNQTLKISLLCGIGGLLEFYDFILYIMFSDQISKNFFAGINSVYVKNFIVIAVFSIAYVIRPLGGLIVGWIGDIRGRKTSFNMTILVMGSCVFLMGIMPTYSQIGIAASFIFICLRIAQGFALGGELPSAIVFVFESLKKKGLALGIMFGIVVLGLVFGNFMSIILRNLFDDYAWRVAFISGSVVAFLSFYVRTRLQETSLFKYLEHKEKFPPAVVLNKYLRNTIGSIFCVVVVAFYGVIISLYIPKYLTTYLDYNVKTVSWIMLCCSFTAALGIAFMSWLSDYINYHKAYQRLSIALVILAYPMFYLINTRNEINLAIGVLVLSLTVSFSTGLFMRLLCEAFPTQVRLTGVAIAYNVAFAIVGGIAPLTTEFLVKQVSVTAGPVIMSIICGVFGIISIPLLAKEQFLD